jgi:MSHA pilin protein MshD
MSIETARARQHGVTLVEMIMFMVIISVALAGILQIMRFTTANSADPLRRKQALMIAEALLEEVRQAGFTYCDPSSGNADTAANTAECNVKENWGKEVAGALRPYDNVNDYVSASATPVAAFNGGGASLLDALGRPMDLAGYSATVSIMPDRLGDIAAGTGADSEALRIRIVVTYTGGDTPVTLDGYRARYAPIQGAQ